MNNSFKSWSAKCRIDTTYLIMNPSLGMLQNV